MQVVADTSLLIAGTAPTNIEVGISVASLAELHFGLLVALEEERAERARLLGVVESTFDPLPVDAAVAREWGRLAAAVTGRGGSPRRRAMDLVIAATANVRGVELLTHDLSDLSLIDDLVQAREP
ncbi:MAG: PIN domain-containing protein [Gaiellales bacterium]